MRTKTLLLLATAFFATIIVARANDSRRPAVLKAIATADTDAVHPDSVFEVTLSLENPTDVVQTIRIPDCGWDRNWKSSNRHVTWDFWDCDYNEQITVQIQPHQSYVFPKTLRMFVTGIGKESRVEFKMGFKTTTFGKVIWSAPIALDVTP